MPPMIDLTGKQFGLLKVLGRDEKKRAGMYFGFANADVKKSSLLEATI